MTEVIQAILTPINTIVHFVGSLISGSIQLVKNITMALSFFDKALGALPPVLYATALCFITVAVICAVIGR